MKNKSSAKVIAGDKTTKSPIVKAKNAPSSQRKNNSSPKQHNGKANKVQNGKIKKEKQNKVPVMNEASDSDVSDSARSNNKVPKFAGTAALGDAPIANVFEKKGKKNKKSPISSGDGDDAETPAKKVKQDNPKNKLKADGVKKRNKNSNIKRRKIGLVNTLSKYWEDKDFKKLEELLPSVIAEIGKMTTAKSESHSAKRKLRILQSYVRKIKSGNYEPAPSQMTTKVKNMSIIPAEVQKEELCDDDNMDSDDDKEDSKDDNNIGKDVKSATKINKGKKLAMVQKAEDKVSGKDQKKAGKKTRFVLFVGNLNFDTKEDAIKAHFQKAGDAISVRLGKHKDSDKSKGFCHIEFDTEEAYQRALSMHHTQLNKRQINVMVTNSDNQKAPQDKKKNNAKVKDMKLKGMKGQGLLAGSAKDSSKRSARRKKAARNKTHC